MNLSQDAPCNYGICTDEFTTNFSLSRIQEIPDRTHWTDPSTWVSNCSIATYFEFWWNVGKAFRLHHFDHLSMPFPTFPPFPPPSLVRIDEPRPRTRWKTLFRFTNGNILKLQSVGHILGGGGMWAIYKWYISGIYCQLGDYMVPIPPIKGTRKLHWLPGQWLNF